MHLLYTLLVSMPTVIVAMPRCWWRLSPDTWPLTTLSAAAGRHPTLCQHHQDQPQRGEMHRWRHQYHGDGHKTFLIYHVFLGSKSSAIKCTSSIASNTNPLSIANTVAVTHHNERSTVPGPRPPTHPPHSTLGRCRALPALCYCN